MQRGGLKRLCWELRLHCYLPSFPNQEKDLISTSFGRGWSSWALCYDTSDLGLIKVAALCPRAGYTLYSWISLHLFPMGQGQHTRRGLSWEETPESELRMAWLLRNWRQGRPPEFPTHPGLWDPLLANTSHGLNRSLPNPGPENWLCHENPPQHKNAGLRSSFFKN